MTQETNNINLIYLFQVYTNPRTLKRYLLFKGVGELQDNFKYEKVPKYDWQLTRFNHYRLNNYYDLLPKLGELPCYMVDSKEEIIPMAKFNNQKEVEEAYDIKMSKLMQAPFKQRNTIKMEKINAISDDIKDAA